LGVAAARLLLDGGNLVGSLHPDRQVLQVARQALSEMGYAGGTIGPAELRLGSKALRELPTNGLPLVLTNVESAAGEPLGERSLTLRWGKQRAELLAVIHPSLVPSEYICRDPQQALSPRVRRAHSERRIVILTSYLPPDDLKALLQQVTGISIVMAQVQDGSNQPQIVNGTWIVPLPSSGRALHLVRLRMARGRVANVAVEPIDIPPSVRPDSQISDRVREFFASRRLTLVSGRTPIELSNLPKSETIVDATSQECGSCHEPQARQWAGSKHAHAWETLRTENAQARAECVGCHTTPLLRSALGSSTTGVGCTTCHGDGFGHAAEPKNPDLIIRKPDESVCRECHTTEASPHFNLIKYLKAVSH
jgi:hypothetical protein